MAKTTAMVSAERIEARILVIRGHRVMLDSDWTNSRGLETLIDRIYNVRVFMGKEKRLLALRRGGAEKKGGWGDGE